MDKLSELVELNKEMLKMMKQEVSLHRSPTPLNLSSLNCSRGPSHDFTTTFNPVMRFDPNIEYYVALDSLSMSYSWYNVSNSYSNNKLKYSHDSGNTWTEIE